MKISLLHISILFLLQTIIQNVWLKIFFSIILLVLCVWNRKYGVLVLSLCLLSGVHYYIFNSLPNHNRFTIQEVHANYAIGSAQGRNVIIYNHNSFRMGDIVEVEEMPNEIKYVKTFFSNGFQQWLLRKRIKYELSSSEYLIVGHNKTLASLFKERISGLGNNEIQVIFNKILFGVNDELIKDSVLSNGMGLLSLYYLSKKCFLLFMKKEKVKIISFFYSAFLVLFLRQWLVALRIFLNEILLKRIDNQQDRIAYMIMILLTINPSFVYYPAFYLPLIFQLYNLFSLQRKRWDRLLLMLPFYLSMQYKVNIIELLLFRVYQSYIGIVGLIGMICMIFGLKFPIENIPLLNQMEIPSFSIIGNMNVMLVFLWYFILIKMGSNIKKYIILISLLFYVHHQSLFNPFYEVTQLYIGQGDCTIIRFPFKEEVMIIDTGSGRNWHYLENFLLANSIKKISVLLISHEDEDHNGNQKNLEQEYQIDFIVNQESLLEYGNIIFYFLNQEKQYDNDNDNSKLVYFSMNGLNYLYLGDVSSLVEERILKEYVNIAPNIVKISHHGSKTGTSRKLVEKPSILLAIISSGLNNSYGHPSQEVMKRLFEAFIVTLDTKENGDIQIKGLFNINLLITSIGRFVIM